MRPGALILAVVLGVTLAVAARAETIVLGLSAEEVAITVTFDGSDLLIFGAVRRDAPAPSDPLEVIVTVAGPLTPVTVRRAARVAGIWANTEAAHVDAAPSFYAVATTGPLSEILSSIEDQRHAVSIPRAIRSVGNTMTDAASFTDALIRIQVAAGLYQMNEETVDFEEQTLFRTAVELPANLIEGNYTIRILLTRNARVIDILETTIGVQKVGLERWLFNLSREQGALYGLLALALAIAAGWSASAAFRFIRR